MDALVNFQPLLLVQLKSGDYVGFTFSSAPWYGCHHCVFLLPDQWVEGKWKDSLLVSGLITFIAAVHYFYMPRLLGGEPGFSDRIPLHRLDSYRSFDVRGILPHPEGFHG